MYKLQPLTEVRTVLGETQEFIDANIRSALKRKLPWLSGCEEVKDGPLAIVAGGPSLSWTKDDLRKFGNVMACGSSHDWCIANGVKPSYTVLLDPAEIVCDWLKTPDKDCLYLVASQCAPNVFDTLKDYRVGVWHAAAEKMIPELEGMQLIGGGCTAALRAISLAIILGYHDLHLFGFDSCIWDNEKSHAYSVDDVHKNMIRDRKAIVHFNGRQFVCAPYMIAQALNFKDILKLWREHFTPTVYGDGLIAEICKSPDSDLMVRV